MDKLKSGFVSLQEKAKETAANATQNIQEKAMNKLVSTLESAENFNLNDFISSLTSGPEMRNVNVNENSDILGNKLRTKFKQFMEENGLAKVIEDALTGFQSYFDKQVKIQNVPVESSSYTYMKQHVGEAIKQVLVTFVTLSVNTKEHKFKTDLFRAVLKKIPGNFSYINNPRYIQKKDASSGTNTPSQYYKTLMANIGQKMVNILKTYRRSGGSVGIQPITQFGGSVDDDETPDMDCFLNNRSAQIVREFFEYNVSSKDLRESISTELVNMLFTIYNDQEIREKICSKHIDPNVDKLIQSAIDDIITLFCKNPTSKGGDSSTIQLPLETLYVLLDDPYIQRIIQKAGYEIAGNVQKLSNAFSKKSKEKDPTKKLEEANKVAKEVDTLFNNIITTLQKPEFSKKPAREGLLDLIIRKLSPKKPDEKTLPAKAKQTGGDGKIHIGPSDYNIMLIISTIVSETIEDINKRLGENLNKGEIQKIIVDFFNDPENQENFLPDDQMNDVYNTVYKCLFETFTDTFRLHVFYVNNMYTKALKIDDADTINSDNAREQYVHSKDPEWIINIVKNLSNEATYKEEAPVLIKYEQNPKENTNGNSQANTTSNAENTQQFNISYQQEIDENNPGQWVPSNHPQINSIISQILLRHFISTFKDKGTHEKIEPITTAIIQYKMENISGSEYRKKHPPFSLLLQNCFQKPKEQKDIPFENPDTNVIQLLKKVLRNSLLGFHNIQSGDDIISKKEECIRFAVFCYISDYLYTGSQTSKVNRPLNLGALHFQSKYSTFLGSAYKTILSDDFIHVFQEGNSATNVTDFLTEYSKNLLNSDGSISASMTKLRKSMVSTSGKEVSRLADETLSVMPEKIQKYFSKKESSNPTVLQAEFVITNPTSNNLTEIQNPLVTKIGGKSTKRLRIHHTKRMTRKRKTDL